MATITTPDIRTTSGSGTRNDRPWNVIVKNDAHNTFEGVATILSRVLPGMSYEKGMRLADSIHKQGQAIVWSGHREIAELYWEQLTDAGLTMAPLENAS